MSTATATAPRFYAARAEGRYRVIDGHLVDARTDGDAPGSAYVAVCASRAKAEEKAAKLNAEATITQAEAFLADQEEARRQEAIAAQAAEDAKVAEAAAVVPAAKPAKAKDDTVAYRIGKILREWVLANEARYAPALVEHIKGRNVCYDDTATLRLSAAWAAELSAAATDVENAALSGPDEAQMPVAQRAPAVMAARAARKGLAKLF